MKTEWRFPWRAHDFRFTKTIHFLGTVGETIDGSVGALDGMRAEVRIEPDPDEPSDRRGEQTGSLFITLPLPPEPAESVAYAAARIVGEQVSFRNGDFRVHFGIVTCCRIPENPEEEAAIDDKPYSVHMSLVEVVPPPEFDGSQLAALGAERVSTDLLAEFNEARRDVNPIRKFLGFFRVLESLSYSGRDPRTAMKDALRAFNLLRVNYLDLLPGSDFDAFVHSLVEARHQCAHLKAENGFGYVPHDPSVHRDIVPQLRLLEELTYRCLEGYTPEARTRTA